MRVIDRIFEYLHHHRLNAYTFERECGIANGYLNKQKRGKGTIGSEILEKISQKYKDLNLTWLITGKGSMLIDGTYSTDAKSSAVYESTPQYGSDVLVKSLREKISILENALADKEKIIRLLEERSNRKT